jgi:hypothetical protein
MVPLQVLELFCVFVFCVLTIVQVTLVKQYGLAVLNSNWSGIGFGAFGLIVMFAFFVLFPWIGALSVYEFVAMVPVPCHANNTVWTDFLCQHQINTEAPCFGPLCENSTSEYCCDHYQSFHRVPCKSLVTDFVSQNAVKKRVTFNCQPDDLTCWEHLRVRLETGDFSCKQNRYYDDPSVWKKRQFAFTNSSDMRSLRVIWLKNPEMTQSKSCTF